MREKIFAHWTFKIACLLVLAYATFMLFACGMADRMIFQPPPASYDESAESLVRFGPNDEFAGFYYPARREGAPTLLWAHGNGEDAGHTSVIAQRFQTRGLGVLVYDYPGYGFSTEKPSEKGTYQSAEEAYRFLVETQKKDPEQIFFLGQSVGSGPATYLAEKFEAKGLILISPFKSAFRVVTKVKILPFDRFDNWKRMPKVKMPLLVIHGDQDNVVPFEQGQELYERHKGPKTFVKLEGISHNDIWPSAEKRVADAILKFVEPAKE